jgi:hypothetical protein
VTWLNQERWKDAGGATVMSTADREAAEKRLAKPKRRDEEEMRQLAQRTVTEWRVIHYT